jgi:hypothetical protein
VRRQEFSIRQLREPVAAAADAREGLDLVVPRRDLVVAHGPWDRDALFRIRFEVERREAVALARPHERFAADVVSAQPVELVDLDVGVIEVVDEPVGIGGRGVAGAALDRLSLPRFLGDAVRVRQLPGVFRRGGVLAVPDHPSAVEHQGLETFFRELLGGPSAADPGSHDDRIE